MLFGCALFIAIINCVNNAGDSRNQRKQNCAVHRLGKCRAYKRPATAARAVIIIEVTVQPFLRTPPRLLNKSVSYAAQSVYFKIIICRLHCNFNAVFCRLFDLLSNRSLRSTPLVAHSSLHSVPLRLNFLIGCLKFQTNIKFCTNIL